MHGYEHVVRGVSKLLRVAKLLSIPTVSTTQYTRALGPLDPALQPHLDALAQAGLHYGPSDKTLFSMCIPEVIKHITDDVDRVVLVGIESHICVLQTLRDLRILFPNAPAPLASVGQVSVDSPPAHLPTVNRNRVKPLQLVVLADCVSSTNPFEVTTALQTMRSQLSVQVSTSECLGYDLMVNAKNPLFKEFSRIMKEEKPAANESAAFWAGTRM
ncbi:hypothetical protein V5O48_000798 [Marasmius crinis-equi]|uniref:Isochorismatase-like domain-containing protein n=1 Tax=Marasmius crinis-equi TaxID=585013 RepID=A0ABR3G079_9AGAR